MANDMARWIISAAEYKIWFCLQRKTFKAPNVWKWLVFGMLILSSSLRWKPMFIERIQPLADFSLTNDFCFFKPNRGYGILGAFDSD